MKPSSKRFAALVVSASLLVGINVIVAMLVFFGPSRRAAQPVQEPVASVPHAGDASLPATAAVTNLGKSLVNRQFPQANNSESQKHPFAVAHESAAYRWTAEDGKDTNVIRRLAHNELEYGRMVKENSAIFRRQLVYHKEGFMQQARQATQSGQGIRQVTLPGMDGQEWQVSVTKTDLEHDGARGVFYGKLAGRPDSLVTVAFINDREAFTLISPQDSLYLLAESHEPGELVVKSVDPQTYGGVCGNQ